MELRDFINDADMVLVGIGEEFQEKFLSVEVEEERRNTIFEEYARKKYLDQCETGDVDEAYKKLAELIQNKNYFIVTLCNDDKIYRSGLKEERIVAPCGTYQSLQCEEVCTEEIYSIKDYEQELSDGRVPVCPCCGSKLVMNHLGCSKYSEEGYLKKWDIYMKWLQGTLNKKICILELGVGMTYPSVIRWPFEKIVFFNNKAKFIRVHSFLYQLSEEIKEKGIGIEKEPVEFLRNQIV